MRRSQRYVHGPAVQQQQQQQQAAPCAHDVSSLYCGELHLPKPVICRPITPHPCAVRCCCSSIIHSRRKYRDRWSINIYPISTFLLNYNAVTSFHTTTLLFSCSEVGYSWTWEVLGTASNTVSVEELFIGLNFRNLTYVVTRCKNAVLCVFLSTTDRSRARP